MKLLHPFMPFLTEAVYTGLPGSGDTVMTAAWPLPDANLSFPDVEKTVLTIMSGIRAVRNVRTDMHVPPSRKADIIVVSTEADVLESFRAGAAYVSRLAQVSDMTLRGDAEGIPSSAVSAVFEGGTIFIPLGALVDLDKERERLSRERDKANREQEQIQKKLANEQFVSRAPDPVVQLERDKLARCAQMMADLESRLRSLDE